MGGPGCLSFILQTPLALQLCVRPLHRGPGFKACRDLGTGTCRWRTGEHCGLAPQRDIWGVGEAPGPRAIAQGRPFPQPLCPSLTLRASASQAQGDCPDPTSSQPTLRSAGLPRCPLPGALRLHTSGSPMQGPMPYDRAQETPRGHSLKETPALRPAPRPDPPPSDSSQVAGSCGPCGASARGTAGEACRRGPAPACRPPAPRAAAARGCWRRAACATARPAAVSARTTRGRLGLGGQVEDPGRRGPRREGAAQGGTGGGEGRTRGRVGPSEQGRVVEGRGPGRDQERGGRGPGRGPGWAGPGCQGRGGATRGRSPGRGHRKARPGAGPRVGGARGGARGRSGPGRGGT